MSANLLLTGSREENGNVLGRGDLRLGLADPGLLLRAQVLDRRRLDFASNQTWEGFKERTGGGESFGLYHGATGSRLLYGTLHESGLSARIRNPWSRSAPYAENRRPSSTDLRTTVSAVKVPEAHLFLSSPRIGLSGSSLRTFASARIASQGNLKPAFSGGLEGFFGKTSVLAEGFFTGTELPAREPSSWFGDPPPLPARDFRLGAGSLSVGSPYISFATDLALSRTFAYGNGFYANAAVRLRPPVAGTNRAGPWSLSLAFEGMGNRYVGSDGSAPGGGMRTAGRIEKRGPRGSLFRAETGLRAANLGTPFEIGSAGLSYRFPSPPGGTSGGGAFPIRVSVVSLEAGRNASNPTATRDALDGILGLSVGLPPMLLPPSLLPASASRPGRKPKPAVYPLAVNLSASLRCLDSSDVEPSPYPFIPSDPEFQSLKTGCELSWSPGIFQFRTKWSRTAFPDGDEKYEGSASLSVRFRRGRLGARISWPDLGRGPKYGLSWRMEM